MLLVSACDGYLVADSDVDEGLLMDELVNSVDEVDFLRVLGRVLATFFEVEYVGVVLQDDLQEVVVKVQGALLVLANLLDCQE